MILPDDGGPLTAEAVRDLRTVLCDTGYQFIPEGTGTKYPPRPYSQWRDMPPFDPTLIYRNQYGPLLNTALRLTATVALDLDIDDPDDVSEVVDILSDQLGPSRCIRARSNSPRQALLYRSADPQASFVDTWKGDYGAVECFCGPRTKLTSFGLHVSSTTGVARRLTWHETPGNVRLDELGAVTREAVQRAMNAAKGVLGDNVREWHRIPSETHDIDPSIIASDMLELVKAMNCIPNEGSDWHAWNRWGLALYGATNGDELGLRAWQRWSAQHPDSRYRDCLSRWLAFAKSPPQRIGAAAIFGTAFRYGYRKPAPQAAADRLNWAKQQTQKSRVRNFTPRI